MLRAAIREGKDFEKAHAAEALIWSGKPDGVREYFLEKIAPQGPSQCTASASRASHRANAGRPAEEEKYFQKIMAVFSDAKASDRGTAAETLAKLKYAGRTELVLDLAAHGKDDMRGSARWILANSGKTEDEAYLAEMLSSRNPQDCAYAAYAFRHFKTIRPTTLKALQALVAEGSARRAVLRPRHALYASAGGPKEVRQAGAPEICNHREYGTAISGLHGFGQLADPGYDSRSARAAGPQAAGRADRRGPRTA